jgi:hypothetical protein
MLATNLCVSDLGSSFNYIKDMESREKIQWLGSENLASLSWQSDIACSSDSEEALENWQNKMYEVSTR